MYKTIILIFHQGGLAGYFLRRMLLNQCGIAVENEGIWIRTKINKY